MSTFIDLASELRDREQFSNPAKFVVTESQQSSWFPNARTVRAFPQQVSQRQMEAVTTVKLIHLVLPYQDDIIDTPIVYVHFHTQKYRDKSLISTISNNQPEATFVCEFDKVQNNSAGDPAWIHYKTQMAQVMRFSRRSHLYFEVTFLDGTTLNITDTVPPAAANPLVQVHATFELIPYIRDDEFSNHLVDTMV
jgi:hypothetical protein